MQTQRIPFYIIIVLLLNTFSGKNTQAALLPHAPPLPNYLEDPVIKAAITGETQAVQRILKEEALDKTPMKRFRYNKALSAACFYGHKGIVQLLLNEDVGCLVAPFAWTADRDRVEIATLLLEHKNITKYLDIIGHVLIDIAIQNMSFSIAKELLDRGACPEAYALVKFLGFLKKKIGSLRNEDLQRAICCVKILMNCNINPVTQQETSPKDSSLHLLARLSHLNLLHQRQYFILAHTLLDACIAEYNLSTNESLKNQLLDCIPLVPLVNIITSYISFVDVRNEDGDTPFIVAAQEGNEFLCKLFLKAGADPTIEDRNAKEALSLFKGSKQTIHRLQTFKPDDEIDEDSDFYFDNANEEYLASWRFRCHLLIMLIAVIAGTAMTATYTRST